MDEPGATPAPWTRRHRRRLVAPLLLVVAAVVVGLVVLAASAGDDPAQDAVVVVGSDDEPWNLVASAAIADLEEYWGRALPAAFGVRYHPVGGGFFAHSPGDPLPPCALDESWLVDNAYYCEAQDALAWDDTVLLPRFHRLSGALGVALVLAHEWGHAVQARVGVRATLPVVRELQADCFAGAWFGHVRDGGSTRFTAGPAEIDRALANLLELADRPGTPAADPTAHGSASARSDAFRAGLDGGPARCAAVDEGEGVVEPFGALSGPVSEAG
jgi:predicted metalloprotease